MRAQKLAKMEQEGAAPFPWKELARELKLHVIDFAPDARTWHALALCDKELAALTKRLEARMMDRLVARTEGSNMTKWHWSTGKLPNGSYHGLDISWQGDVMRSRVNYFNDERHGTSETWDERGRPEKIEEYDHGVGHGPCRMWTYRGYRGNIWCHDDTEREYRFDRGLMHGVHRRYQLPARDLIEETYYFEDRKCKTRSEMEDLMRDAGELPRRFCDLPAELKRHVATLVPDAQTWSALARCSSEMAGYARELRRKAQDKYTEIRWFGTLTAECLPDGTPHGTCLVYRLANGLSLKRRVLVPEDRILTLALPSVQKTEPTAGKGRLWLVEGYELGVKQGWHRRYNRRGWVTKVEHYVDGLLHGLSESYSYLGEGETCREIGSRLTPYVRGKIHGTICRYGYNKRLIEQSEYVDGESHGDTVFYHYGVADKLREAIVNAWEYDQPHGRSFRHSYPGRVLTFESFHYRGTSVTLGRQEFEECMEGERLQTPEWKRWIASIDDWRVNMAIDKALAARAQEQ